MTLFYCGLSFVLLYLKFGVNYKELLIKMYLNQVLFYTILLTLISRSYVLSMTKQQIKSSGKLLKKSCMPKNDVTEDQVGDIDKGKFIEDKNVMCYIACVYSMSQAVKNNKISHDAMIKQVDMMFPPDMKEPVKAAIESCRGVAKKYKDVCEASFWTAKCIYEFDPSNFVFA